MKTSNVVIMAAVSLIVTGIAVGTAQAGGTRSERPVLSFEDMASLEQAGPSSSSVENRPVLSLEDERIREAGESPSRGMQLGSPIETGTLPSESDAASYILDTEANMRRGGVDTDSP